MYIKKSYEQFPIGSQESQEDLQKFLPFFKPSSIILHRPETIVLQGS